MRLENARDYVGLPWAWIGPTELRDEAGNQWWEVRIAELPDFLVAEETAEAARAVVGEALEAFIDSYLARGETPPMPAKTNTGPRFSLVAA